MTIPAAQPQKREVKPAGSYTGQAPISSFAAPSGLLFNKITVIQSRDTVQSNQPLARKSPQCQEHKSPSPRRALHSCSTWGPLMPFTALRNSRAGAALLQAPSAATSPLLAPGPFGATEDSFPIPEKAWVDLLHCPRACARCCRRGWKLSFLAALRTVMVLNSWAVPANPVILPHYVLMKQRMRQSSKFSGVLFWQGWEMSSVTEQWSSEDSAKILPVQISSLEARGSYHTHQKNHTTKVLPSSSSSSCLSPKFSLPYLQVGQD